jgi:glutamine synthetase type III
MLTTEAMVCEISEKQYASTNGSGRHGSEGMDY